MVLSRYTLNYQETFPWEILGSQLIKVFGHLIWWVVFKKLCHFLKLLKTGMMHYGNYI